LGTLIKRLFTFAILLLIPLLLILFFYVHSLTSTITERFSGKKWDVPSRVYSDTSQIYPGLNIASIDLIERLDRLGYRHVTDRVMRHGEYKIVSDPGKNQMDWTLYLHDFDYPLKSFRGIMIRFVVSDNIILTMEAKKSVSDDFDDLDLAQLEPELITEFFKNARESRKIVKLQEVPTNLLHAIISVEDQRFLTHGGIDPKGIVRAFFSNLRAGSIVQGGSTITQQLVKNFFLTQKRSYIRKFNEAVMALILESRYSKDDILEAYVNEVYFGQRGSAGVFGVAEAARFYFAKPLNKLTLAECAMLAGIIRGPGVYSMLRHPKRALERRNFVLKKMLETKTVLWQEVQEALQEPLRPRNIPATVNAAPYFVDFVRQELLQRYSSDILNTEGLRIFTTLDVSLQRFAREAVKKTLAQLERGREEDLPIQGAFVALHPQTGYIRALVGGRDYQESQFNRATQAYRQPGSLFKPLVLLTALSIKRGRKFKLTDKYSDEPFQWKYGKQLWEPKNYDKDSRGEVSLREAVVYSINIPIARLAKDVGIKHIARLAKKMGIQSKLPRVPSLALGGIEVTPLDMATVYGVLANGGTHALPISVKHVINNEGKILEKRTVTIKKVVSEEATYLVTDVLQDVINKGTGRGVRLFGYSRKAAGKTGTTNEAMDAWFAGYTPDLVGVSWVGYDKEKPLGLTGAQAALPIWARFMIKATASRPLSDFFEPENIVKIKIDPESGLLANKKCPSTFEEIFIKGTEPKKPCPLHK